MSDAPRTRTVEKMRDAVRRLEELDGWRWPLFVLAPIYDDAVARGLLDPANPNYVRWQPDDLTDTAESRTCDGNSVAPPPADKA